MIRLPGDGRLVPHADEVAGRCSLGHAWLVVNGLGREQVTVSVPGAIAELARRVGHADITIDDSDLEVLLQPDQG